ncbi:hypothetical protein ACFE04_016792 [Oxalis oulophora]
MALLIYWYDFICFGIVVGAFIGALWVLWMKEAATKCEGLDTRLLTTLPDGQDWFVNGVVTCNKAHVGSSQLWTSCWKELHPGWLLATRFVSFVVMVGVLTWDVMTWEASVLMYYTDLSSSQLGYLSRLLEKMELLLTTFGTYVLGTVISAYGCWVTATRPSTVRLYVMEDFRHKAGFWGHVFQALYQTCGGAVCLTDIVFWCLIAPFSSNAHLSLNTLMCCMHTLNAAFLLIDTYLNSLPFPWFRIAYFVQWSCIYIVFQWLIHACGFSWWPYPFIQLDTPWAPLW